MLNMKQGCTASREEIRAIAIPEREDVSGRWKGVGHADLLDSLDATLADRGVSTHGERLALGDDGQTLYGSVILAGTKLAIPGDINLALGFRHSNMSRHALTLWVGAVVLVCSNGMVAQESSAATIRRKHTSGLNLDQTVAIGVDSIGVGLDQIKSFKRSLISQPLSEGETAETLVMAGRQGILPWSQIGKVDKVYNSPNFPVFAERNRWSLYNAFTEVIRDRSPLKQLPALAATTALFSGDGRLN